MNTLPEDIVHWTVVTLLGSSIALLLETQKKSEGISLLGFKYGWQLNSLQYDKSKYRIGSNNSKMNVLRGKMTSSSTRPQSSIFSLGFSLPAQWYLALLVLVMPISHISIILRHDWLKFYSTKKPPGQMLLNYMLVTTVLLISFLIEFYSKKGEMKRQHFCVVWTDIDVTNVKSIFKFSF